MKQKFLHVPDTLILLGCSAFILLDTFVIPRKYAAVSEESSPVTASTVSDASVTDTSYTDDHVSISIQTYDVDNTKVYVADVQISDVSYLQSFFAENSYGKNITETTSAIASDANAILAVNGDFYEARNSGYVIRNGVLYRDTVSDEDQEDLAILSDGSFRFFQEGDTSAQEILEEGAEQVYSFGPALVSDGEISVSENEEVGKAMSSNPRTAIAEISPLHYLFVAADGRTDESEGLSLYQMAEFLQELGAVNAYNLDGGGSTTMVFNGTVINKPTTMGNRIEERSVSDIVAIIA
jgi:exopolysaccharide biosynthesis protein